ncbi:zinc-binding protein A33 [Xyrauchen texanus]|uniref:zinc-binding protein A33 n=1 Tax=Xyrauchen texanus TaxID=154827 RepID=UPI00224276D9|nr:zinc-binding protein A33 [Xyrauchen texanus]
MASKRQFSDDDFTCPVCYDIFKNPVLLQCGHSVCGDCVKQYWRTKGSRECPLCRKRCTRNPPVNLALRSLCETFLHHKGPLEELCEVHREKLSLFCEDDQLLVCVTCQDSVQHITHTCHPISEAAEERKGVLRSELKFLTRKIKMIKDARFDCDQKAEHIQFQSRHTENIIKNEFKHLHQLLYDEEATMLAQLSNENEQKTQRMKDERKLQKMTQDILSLSNTIRSIRKELECGDVRFLQYFKNTLDRAQDTLRDVETVEGELIDTAKYLGNLRFNVWTKIRESINYSPVVLDPNTANSQLILSEDLTSVRDSDELEDDDMEDVQRKQLPNNLERFDRCPCVLGSVGYTSGTHTWDVDVGDNTFWMLGVTTESVQRKGVNGLPTGVWCIGYDGDVLSLKAPLESYIPLHGCMKPKHVRVQLNLNSGQLSFSDPLSKTLYHTFTPHFTEKVFPFFYSLCSVSPLRILPVAMPCN